MNEEKLDIVEDVDADLLSQEEQEELSISEEIDRILEADSKKKKVKHEDEHESEDETEDESEDKDESEDEDKDESEDETEDEDKKMTEYKKSGKKMKEGLEILVSAEANLSEGFKEKAQTLFEAAISEKIVIEKERLEELHEEKLRSELEQVRDHFTDQIDSYLGYVVEAFVEENQGLVESVCRTEIAENFMKKLQGVFVESYIEVPESKRDLVEELSSEIEQTRDELEESASDLQCLAEGVISLKREQVLAESSKDLTDTEAEKLQRLTAELDFQSVEKFQSKLNTIKESVFNVRTEDAIEEEAEELFEEVETSETQTIVEGEEIQPEDDQPKRIDPEIAKYVSFLSH